MNCGDFINHGGATLEIHDTALMGMRLRVGSTFENQSGGLIDIYNTANPEDKLIIDRGAEVSWDQTVEIKNP